MKLNFFKEMENGIITNRKIRQASEDAMSDYENKHLDYGSCRIIKVICELAEVLYEQTSEINRKLETISSNLAEIRNGVKTE